jgi:hypothetical protein
MQFLMDQGQHAISGPAAAGGTLQSGATGKALEKFGTNLGSTYLNDYMNHLLDYAKLGLGSATALSGAGGVSSSSGGSQSTGSSGSTSYGNSQSTSSGSSFGNSQSTGTSSGAANSKKGLIPDILG